MSTMSCGSSSSRVSLQLSPSVRSSMHDQRVERSLSRVLAATHPSGEHPTPELLSSYALALTVTEVLSLASTNSATDDDTDEAGGAEGDASGDVVGAVGSESGSSVGATIGDGVSDDIVGVIDGAMDGAGEGDGEGSVGSATGGADDDTIGQVENSNGSSKDVEQNGIIFRVFIIVD